MKNLFIIFISIFLIGCGGGSNSTTVIEDNSSIVNVYEISMELYKPYIITTGDKIIKKTEDAQIKITHIENDINSTVELIDGEANLIYLTPIQIENNEINSSYSLTD